MLIKKWVCVFIWMGFYLPGLSQSKDAEDAIFLQAKEQGKYVLLVFSGSDWCNPCIRFEKHILSQQAFQDFEKEKLIVLRADFPQRKKLSQEIVSRNERLAEKYNTRGDFPKIILLNESGSIVSIIDYNRVTVSQFISRLNEIISHERSKGVQTKG